MRQPLEESSVHVFLPGYHFGKTSGWCWQFGQHRLLPRTSKRDLDAVLSRSEAGSSQEKNSARYLRREMCDGTVRAVGDPKVVPRLRTQVGLKRWMPFQGRVARTSNSSTGSTTPIGYGMNYALCFPCFLFCWIQDTLVLVGSIPAHSCNMPKSTKFFGLSNNCNIPGQRVGVWS